MNKFDTFHKKGAPDLIMQVRDCVPEDLDAILAIQEKVVKMIPERYRYVPTEKADIVDSFEKDVCLCVCHNGRLVGYSCLLSLRDTPRNLAVDLGYPPEYARLCTTNDGSWVDPEYQGYGIQYYLSIEKDAIAAEMGAVELLACTSPVNYASQRSMIKNGYSIIGEMELFGGLPRLILQKMVPECVEEITA